MVELLEWFVLYAYAQIAGIALVLAALTVYAWMTRGKTHFLTEMLTYLGAFVAFTLAQAAVFEPIDRSIVRGGFALLALTLWIHTAVIVRAIVLRLAGREE